MYIFHIMRVGVPLIRRQVLVLVACLFAASCNRSSDEIPLEPPPTHPLVRDFIGFGVVNTSFTHISDKPGAEGVSQGYLRKGSLVKVIERRSVSNQGNVEFWVFIDGAYREESAASGFSGWLREGALDIYDSEAKAMTASEAMLP
jgi:hypothetical protein